MVDTLLSRVQAPSVLMLLGSSPFALCTYLSNFCIIAVVAQERLQYWLIVGVCSSG